MKLSFDDGSYIEIKKSSEPDKILVLIQAKDGENPLKKITNCVEVSTSEFTKLVAEVKI